MPKQNAELIGYRCDVPMKRSKEHGYIRAGVRWRCTGECKTCICCLVKDDSGEEHHIGGNKWKQKNIWNPIG